MRELRELPEVGFTIHRYHPEHKAVGYPSHWSAKVVSIVEDADIKYHLIVCRRWNRFKQTYIYFIIDHTEWDVRTDYKLGSLPKKKP